MSEDTMKSNLLSLYREAVAGNPAPIHSSLPCAGRLIPI